MDHAERQVFLFPLIKLAKKLKENLGSTPSSGSLRFH
jgi:hypothetical protein